MTYLEYLEQLLLFKHCILQINGHFLDLAALRAPTAHDVSILVEVAACTKGIAHGPADASESAHAACTAGSSAARVELRLHEKLRVLS